MGAGFVGGLISFAILVFAIWLGIRLSRGGQAA